MMARSLHRILRVSSQLHSRFGNFSHLGLGGLARACTLTLEASICANVEEHMIANLREFRISKTQAARFQAALQAFDQNPPAGDSILVQAQRDSLTSQLEDLLEEITAFEALHDSKRTSLNLSDLEILPQRLIQARIALGLTQKALADELGVSAQQVQRDEASEYQNASFSRMLEIARVLERYGNDLVLQPA